MNAAPAGFSPQTETTGQKKCLVVGNYRQTITIVRSLRKAGFEVICGCEEGPCPVTYTGHSRALAEVWQHPSERSEAEFVDALERFLDERPDVTHIFVVGELGIRNLGSVHASLKERVQLVMCDPEIANKCLDKAAMAELAKGLQIPIPRGGLTDVAHARSLSATLGFPLIVKKVNSFTTVHGKKALIVSSEAELAELLASYDPSEELIIQERLPGLRHNCNFAAMNGKLIAYVEHRILRTDEPDGTGLMLEGITLKPTPKLVEYCEKMARALNFHGVGCAQFLVDDTDGSAAFIELNPRLDANCDLPVRVGVDFPLLAVQCAERNGSSGAPIPSLSACHYPAGKRAQWIEGELRTISRRSWKDAIRTFVTSDVRLGWYWRDPLPMLCLYLHAIRRGKRPHA